MTNTYVPNRHFLTKTTSFSKSHCLQSLLLYLSCVCLLNWPWDTVCRCMFTALLTLCDNVIGSCSRCVLSSWAGGADWGCLKSFTCRPTRQEFSKTFSFPTEPFLAKIQISESFCLWCSLTLWRLFHQPHAKFPFLPFFFTFLRYVLKY